MGNRVVGKLAGKRFEPKYPFAERAGKLLDAGEGHEGTVPWRPVAASSHVAAVRFYDAREHSFLRKFGGRSELHVKFKKGGGYKYLLADHARLRAIYDDLLTAASPWGDVGYPRLVKAGVPYYRITV